MGRSYEEDFFSEANAVSVADTPFSHLNMSDEEQAEPTVDVRFNADGIAEQVDDEELGTVEPLQPMPLPYKFGASEWGSTFAEVHTRAHELENHTKVTAIRYIQSGSTKKVSCLPSTIDFLADVQIVARKALSPALYRVWHRVYYVGYGEGAHRLPESVQMKIQQRCGVAWKMAGLLPFYKYWHIRTPADKLCAVNLQIVPDVRDERNKRRRAARKARSVISTLKVAA